MLLIDLKNSWWVAQNDLKIVVQDIPGLLVYLLTPIVVIMITAYSLAGVWDRNFKVIDLPVVLQDNGPNTSALLNTLAQDNTIQLQFDYQENGRERSMTTAKARELVYVTKAVLIVPRGFEAGIASGKGASITMVFDPGDHVLSDRVLVSLTRLISKYNGRQVGLTVTHQTVDYIDARLKGQGLKFDQESIMRELDSRVDNMASGTGVEVHQLAASEGKATHVPTPFESYVPGWAVTFMLLGTTFAAATFIDEKEQGTLKRLQAAPISRYSILAGKLISGLVQSNVQMAIIFAIAYIVYGLWLGTDIFGLMALTLATTFAATGLGVLLAAFCKTRWQARGIAIFVVLLNSGLGGCWWPLYLAPDAMQKASRLTLNAWAMDGYSNLLVYGRGFSSITESLIVLALMGVVFLVAATARFGSQEYW
ncbi:MAG: ABC transporter permease [Candidatus Saccharibacteria bacterium]